MQYSGSGRPDLDWSQVRETIKLLAVSVAQVEGGMRIGDESVNVLAGSFANMVEDMDVIRDELMKLAPSAERDNALSRCMATQERIYSSIVAFQFYDRLQQCLSHVSTGLKGLSAIIDDPQRLYNPQEWYKFQNEIRSHYTMESEKAMFDAILHGKSIEEALALVDFNKSNDGNEIELF
ncbi:MAG: hypothetical protein LUQ11_00820 [Methylococcaceae bacterium]|nr:hypothetical protein [Methylococcaceae bacterium]